MSTTHETTAQKMFGWAIEQLDQGRTVALTTHLRSTRITPSNYSKSVAAGCPLLKLSASGEVLLMREGRSYVNANYCKLSAFVDDDE